MFDLQAALSVLNGQTLEFSELQKRLQEIKLANLGELSPEIGTQDLFLIAQRNNWIQEDEPGKLRIVVPGRAA